MKAKVTAILVCGILSMAGIHALPELSGASEAPSGIENQPPVTGHTLTTIAASTTHIERETLLFQGMTLPGWTGNLVALEINMDSGAVVGEKWRAAEKLDSRNMDIDPRRIFTFNDAGKNGVVFQYDNLSDIQKQRLVDPESSVAGPALIAYISGNRAPEDAPGFRKRESILGPIIHSQPVYHDGTVYVGANNGMLHAFDAQTGEERFVYVPGILLDKLSHLVNPEFSGGYYVDATPFARTIRDKNRSWTPLVGGLGIGGKGYFCLDVSNAGSIRATAADALSLVKWEFSDPEDLGYTTSRPLVVNTRAGWGVIFGNGHDSGSGEAVIFILLEIDKPYPTAIKFHTGVSGQNGIVGDVTAIDDNSDGYADYLYAGDLHGNIWKIDMTAENPEKWGFAFKSASAPKPFFTAMCEKGLPQPITTAVDVMRHCSPDLPGYILLFGTGRDETRFGPSTTNQHTVYGLWDWQETWKDNVGRDKFFGTFKRPFLSNLQNAWYGDPNLRNLSSLTLLRQSIREAINLDGEQWLMLTDHPINWWQPGAENTGSVPYVGWYFDLPHHREQILHNPVFRDYTAVVTSTVPATTASAPGTSVLYMLDACTGGEPADARFDVGQDSMVSEDDVITDSKGISRLPTGKMLDAPSAVPLILSNFFYLPGTNPKAPVIIPIRQKQPGVTYWYVPAGDW